MSNRYFAGNSLAAFYRTSTGIAESTSSGKFNSSFVAACIAMPNDGASYIGSTTFSATGSVWMRADIYGPGALSNNSGVGPSLYNGSTPVFKIKTTSIGTTNTTCQAQYWNGSAWVDTGSTFNVATSALITMVARVDLNSGFEVFVGGTSLTSGSGWSGGSTTATQFRGYNWSSQSPTYYSQVMIADYDIRDSKFMSPALNGNSATNTGGTGAYTDVNETVLDDSTALKVTASGNKMGQTKAAITLPAGYIIGAMVISGRGRVSGSIADGKLGVRTTGGTNSSGSGLGYNGGYEPRQRIISSDPDTATNFTQAGFNGAEIYEEAA